MFLSNLAFLQTVVTTTYGSNGPLWSLANEFWYYILIPLCVWTIFSENVPVRKGASAAIVLGLFLLLPGSLLAGGIIWLAGALFGLLSMFLRGSRLFKRTDVQISSIFVVLAAIAATRAPDRFRLNDIQFGLIVAAALPLLVSCSLQSGTWKASTRFFSEISYTLYLSHFPLLTFFVMVFFAPHRMAPTLTAYTIFSVTMIVLIGAAALLWLAFERRTDTFYKAIVSRMNRLTTPSEKPILSTWT